MKNEEMEKFVTKRNKTNFQKKKELKEINSLFYKKVKSNDYKKAH